MNNQSKIIVGVVIILLLSLLGVSYFNGVQLKEESQQVKLVLTSQKEDLQKELKEVESNLVGLKSDNAELNAQLQSSLLEVRKLQQKLQNDKNLSAAEILKYKNQVNDLVEQRKDLFKRLEALKAENGELRTTVAEKEYQIDTIRSNVKKLKSKIEEASVVKIYNVNVFAYTKKSNGVIMPTNKIKKATGIRLSYNIVNNNFLDGKIYKMYYVIRKPNGELFKKVGSFVANGKTIDFTDGSTFKYQGDLIIAKEILVDSGDLEQGTYTIDFYSEKEMLATSKFTLKNSFLGIF